MPSSLLQSLYRCLGIRSLATKVRLVGVALTLVSLLVGAGAFTIGNQLTYRRLWAQRTRTEADGVLEILTQRADGICRAGQALAGDLSIVGAVQNYDLSALSAAAQASRERFDLDLVQIYDQSPDMEDPLVLSSACLYTPTTSSLLNTAESGRSAARVVDDYLLLLCRVPMMEETGTVVVGVDLGAQLEEIRLKERLSTDLAVALRGKQVGTADQLPFDACSGWLGDQYCEKRSTMLGATPAELFFVHSNGDHRRVTQAALIVMIASTLVVALLLSGLSVTVVRSIQGTVGALSAGVSAVGQGDLEREVQLEPNSLAIGEGDELGLLVDRFNEMRRDLRDQCADLESQIEARAAGLRATAGVARAISANLELDVTLRRSAEIIRRDLGEVCPGIHHVGIFLVEKGSEVVVLEEVAGEAKRSLGRGCRLVPAGSKSPVGLAVATRQLQVIQNVRMTSTHLKPPLLIDTYSAAAVPLIVGDTLIGALDVQSRQPGAFWPDTRQLLDTLANQIATAVHNVNVHQRQCQTAERLAEMDQLKTHFLAMMSHKLRAPLNTIAGLSSSLCETVGPLSDRQQRDVSLVRALAQYLLELTDDFLDISKMRAGEITLTLEDVDLRLLIESALDAVAPLVEHKPITLRADLDPDLPIVCADKRRVRQAVLNLLSNAAAFTDAGRICVAARKIEALNVDSGCVEPFVEVRVSDSGLVISGERLSRDLEAFSRPENLRARQPISEGVAAGFGLPITRALINLHGGRLWVDGGSGKEVAFTFVLPIDQPELRRDQIQSSTTLEATSAEVAGDDAV